MQTSSMHKFLKSWFGENWWALPVTVNIFLLAFTIANHHILGFAQKWRLITPFSLGAENNFAVWWAGITLLLPALLAFQRSLTYDKNSLAWLVLSLTLAGLSLDEIGSFHERVGHLKGWLGILPYGILLICLIGYANIKLFRSQQTVINAKYLFIAILLLVSVVIQEYIEHTYAWKSWMLGIRVGVEEGTELLATLFILLSVMYKKDTKLNIQSLLPQVKTFLSLKWVFAFGLIAHLTGSYIITKIGDPFFRGNPMNWYPTALYFCIALICLHKFIYASEKIERARWGVFLTLSLITSIGIMTNLFMIILPGIYEATNTTLNNKNFMIIYIVQLMFFGMLLTKKILLSKTLVITSIAFLFILTWQEQYIEIIWLRYSILGAFSYWTFYLFISKKVHIDKTTPNKNTS